MIKYNFKKNKFTVIKKAVDLKIANFVYNYFLMKRQVAKTMFDKKYIPSCTKDFGVWDDPQVPNTYSHYSDIVMETLLLAVQPIMEKKTGLKLIPTYSYARIYKKGDILHRHIDRFSCEISTTLNIGGDSWPIYIEPNPKIGRILEGKVYIPGNTKGIKINLKPGDMLVYKGNLLEHWREKFKGQDCGQVFLHYNDATNKDTKENIYDRRPHLGLPAWFKK